MKKIFLCFMPGLFFSILIFAQQVPHKIVFDFTKGDTASFGTMIRQAKNVLSIAVDAKLEIVCHGPCLDILVQDKTTVKEEIEELYGKFAVVFVACEFSMRRREIDKNRLLTQVIIVPSAVLEISSKEREGWSYLKGGHNP